MITAALSSSRPPRHRYPLYRWLRSADYRRLPGVVRDPALPARADDLEAPGRYAVYEQRPEAASPTAPVHVWFKSNRDPVRNDRENYVLNKVSRACYPFAPRYVHNSGDGSGVFMELIPRSQNMAQWAVAGNAVTADNLHRVLVLAMSGLDSWHLQHVMHLDVKPENLMVQVTDGQVTRVALVDTSESLIVGDAVPSYARLGTSSSGGDGDGDGDVFVHPERRFVPFIVERDAVFLDTYALTMSLAWLFCQAVRHHVVVVGAVPGLPGVVAAPFPSVPAVHTRQEARRAVEALAGAVLGVLETIRRDVLPRVPALGAPAWSLVCTQVGRGVAQYVRPWQYASDTQPLWTLDDELRVASRNNLSPPRPSRPTTTTYDDDDD